MGGEPVMPLSSITRCRSSVLNICSIPRHILSPRFSDQFPLSDQFPRHARPMLNRCK
jgi:hypothetical protein